MEFEWGDNKDMANIAKHGLSFYEAQTAFLDEKRIIFPDAKHSSEVLPVALLLLDLP